MKRIDPKEQFSKKLATSGAVYWIFCMTGLVITMALVPAVSIACVYMAIIVSVVKIFHVWAYTRNSTYEKALLAILDKTRMELGIKLGTPKQRDSPTETTDNADEEEEGENG